MATKGQLAAGATLAIIGGLGARAVFAKRKRKKKKPAPDNCAPYQWAPGPVAASINSLLDGGGDDRDEVARVTALEHFGNYPGGGTVAFPPGAQPAAGVSCVWGRTLELVDAIIAGRGGFNAKPWEILDEWTAQEGNPEPGSLFKQPQGMVFAGNNGIVGRALTAAGVPNTAQNRVAYLRLIECSPWNDALYNVNLTDQAFAQRFRESPTRGISQNPQHSDNVQRMMQGLAPRRAAVENSMTAHQGGGRHAFMWLPLIEGGAPVPVVAAFNDGLSGINPPAEILAFGLEDVQPRTYGCEEYGPAAAQLPL